MITQIDYAKQASWRLQQDLVKKYTQGSLCQIPKLIIVIKNVEDANS